MCRCYSAHVAAYHGARAHDLAFGSDVRAYDAAWEAWCHWHGRAKHGVRAGSWGSTHAMVPQAAQLQQACDVRAARETHATRKAEARPFTVTLECGDIFAHSAEEAARAFREGMQSDYAAWDLIFKVVFQDTGAVAHITIPADDAEGGK